MSALLLQVKALKGLGGLGMTAMRMYRDGLGASATTYTQGQIPASAASSGPSINDLAIVAAWLYSGGPLPSAANVSAYAAWQFRSLAYIATANGANRPVGTFDGPLSQYLAVYTAASNGTPVDALTQSTLIEANTASLALGVTVSGGAVAVNLPGSGAALWPWLVGGAALLGAAGAGVAAVSGARAGKIAMALGGSALAGLAVGGLVGYLKTKQGA